jgi:hypothetical protein
VEKAVFVLFVCGKTKPVAVEFVPILGQSLLFSTGYPPPRVVHKILKTQDLFYDYVLDL